MRIPSTQYVEEHRRRMEERGFTRVEVLVPREYAQALREFAQHLRDRKQS